MSILQSLFKRVFTFGVLHEQTFTEKRDIIFTNQAVFVLIIATFCIGCIEVYIGYHIRPAVAISTSILLFSCFLFQKKKRYLLAKVFVVAFPIIAISVSTIFFGGEAKAHYYLIGTFILGLVIFHKPLHHKILLAIHVPLFFGLTYYTNNYLPFYHEEVENFFEMWHLFFLFFLIYITLSEFTIHNQQYESRIIQLLDSLKETNEVLEKQKEQIETQANELQRSNLILQKEINEREKAQQKLIASNEELEQYAYVASHDLKEPLRTVGSFVQLLNKKLKPHYDEQANEYQHFIVDGVKRMSSLLDDLLTLSRLNKELEYAAVDLNDVLFVVRKNLNKIVQAKNVEIKYGPLPVITANQAQMTQLFQNLICNGIKFNDKTCPIVEIIFTEKKEHYIFEIKDNGIGIPNEFKEKIFIIFQRLHQRSSYEGTGIGLSICKKIVSNHGGKIRIESLPGHGTSMFFSISKNMDKINTVYSK